MKQYDKWIYEKCGEEKIQRTTSIKLVEHISKWVKSYSMFPTLMLNIL